MRRDLLVSVRRHALVGRRIDRAGAALGGGLGLIVLQLVGDGASALFDRLGGLHGPGLDNLARLGGGVLGLVAGGLGLDLGGFLFGLGTGGGAQRQGGGEGDSGVRMRMAFPRGSVVGLLEPEP